MPSKKRKGTTNTLGCSSNTIGTNDAKRKKLEFEDEAKTSLKTQQDTKGTKGRIKHDEKRIRASQRTSAVALVSSPPTKNKKPGRKGRLKSNNEDKKQSVADNKILPSPSSKAQKLELARGKHSKRISKQSDVELSDTKKRKSRGQESSTDQGDSIPRSKIRKKKKSVKRKSKVKQSSFEETNLSRVGQDGRCAEEAEHISSDENSVSFSNDGRSLALNLKSISCSTDLQTWPEVPSIAHFCSLFRQAFDLLEFDIQELEESLLLMGTEDDTTQLVLRLVIKLLVGCSRTFTRNITEDVRNSIGI